LLPPRDGRYLGVTFSADGNFVYYGYADSDRNDSGDAFKIPVLGIGAGPTKIDVHSGPISTSHDGKRIAFIRYDGKTRADSLVLANSDGSGEQIIAKRKWPARFGWDWNSSPDWTANDSALAVALVNSDANGFYLTIYEINLGNLSERIVPLS